MHFGALEEMGEAQYQLGLRDKLMGQVNLVLLGREYANDGGSFTLTSGVLAEQPIRFGSSASMVNCAVEGFVRGAALELPRGLRINAVSPTVVSEALPGYAPYFRGFAGSGGGRRAGLRTQRGRRADRPGVSHLVSDISQERRSA